MKKYKYRVTFETGLFTGESEGECGAEDESIAKEILTKEIAEEIKIGKSEITGIYLTELS